MTQTEFLKMLKKLGNRHPGYKLMYMHFMMAKMFDKTALDGLVEYLAQAGVEDEESFIKLMESSDDVFEQMTKVVK